MANEYDALVQGNEYDDLLAGDEKRQQLRTTMFGAVRQSADDYAKAKVLERQTGIPAPVIARNLPDVESRAKLNEYDALIGTKTGDTLASNPDIARLAHDDVDTLAEIERTLNRRSAGKIGGPAFERRDSMTEWTPAPERTAIGTLGDAAVTGLKGAVGLPQAFAGLADIPTLGLAGKGLDTLGIRFNDAQRALDLMYSPAQQQANQAVRGADGFFDTLGAAVSNPSVIATTVGESLPQMLGGAAVARGLLRVAPRLGPLFAAAAGEGIVGAGGAAAQIRGETADNELTATQSAAAVASGIGTAVFGLMGGKLAQRFGVDDIDTALARGGIDLNTADTVRKGFVRRIAEGGISEGVFEELPQSAQEQIWQNFALDRPLLDGVGNAAALGLLAGAVTGGGFSALVGVSPDMERMQAQAQTATQDAEVLAQLSQLAAVSKLRPRDPQSFQEFVEATAPGEAVYLDARTLQQSGVDVQALAQASPAVAAQLEEAIASGGDLVIPMSEYAARIAGTDLDPVLTPHLRSSEDAISVAEIPAAEEQARMFQEAAAKVMEERATDDAWQQSAKVVETKLFEQLQGAGRFTDDVNTAYSTLMRDFYVATASRLGITPEEMFARYEQPTDIPNGGAFFANVVETALDRITLLVKQLKERVDRAVTVDVSSAVDPADLIDGIVASELAAAASESAAAASASAADASADAADAFADAAAASAAAAAISEANAAEIGEVISVLDTGTQEILYIGDNAANILSARIETGDAVGDNRAWLPGGVISVEIGDGADIAAWRANGTKGSPTKTLAQDHIAQFYGTGLGDTLFIPDTSTPIYSEYDGENVHVVSGLGPYSYAAVDLAAETDVACYAYDDGDSFHEYRLLVKTTEYTLNLGLKELTLVGAPAENRIVIRRRRDWAGSGPFLGRSGEVIVQAVEDFSDESRAAAVILGVAQVGEVVARPRAFLKKASVVLMGRGSHEDVSGAQYPDNINIGNSLVSKWKGFQGTQYPDNYTPKAIADIWISDIADTTDFNGIAKDPLAAVALRKTSDLDEGWDIGYSDSTDELILYRVTGGVRSKIAGFTLGGVASFGGLGSIAPSFRADPVTSAVNTIVAKGSSTTNDPQLSVEGTDTNITMRLVSKGTGVIEAWVGAVRAFIASAAASAVNYVRTVAQATGNAPIVEAVGSDTNISLVLRGQGTGGVRLGSTSSTAITKVLSTTATVNFASIGANSHQSTTVALSGAVTGQVVFVNSINASLDNAALSFDGWVSASDVVTVYCRNNSTGAIDPGNQTFRIVALAF